MEAKLAPFYRGLEDFEEDWTEDEIAKMLSDIRDQDLEEGVSNSVTERLKEERDAASGIGSVTKKMIHRTKDARREEESQEREKRERRAYIGAVECPICFLVRSLFTVSQSKMWWTLTAAELPFQHQHVTMLPATHLHRVFRPDQAGRAVSHSPRVGARRVSLLRRDGIRSHLRTPDLGFHAFPPFFFRSRHLAARRRCIRLLTSSEHPF